MLLLAFITYAFANSVFFNLSQVQIPYRQYPVGLFLTNNGTQLSLIYSSDISTTPIPQLFLATLSPTTYQRIIPSDIALTDTTTFFTTASSVDGQDNIFVYGETSVGIPRTECTFMNEMTQITSMDSFIMKFTSSGTLLWCKILGSNTSDDSLGNGITDKSGRYVYAIANTKGNFLYDVRTNNSWDFFILRLDPDTGDIKWRFQFGTPNIHDRVCDTHSSSTATDSNGDLFITGFSGDYPLDDGGAFTTKYLFLYKIDRESGAVLKNYTNPLYVWASVNSLFMDNSDRLYWHIYFSGNIFNFTDSPTLPQQAIAQLNTDLQLTKFYRIQRGQIINQDYYVTNSMLHQKRVFAFEDQSLVLFYAQVVSSTGFDMARYDSQGQLVWNYTYYVVDGVRVGPFGITILSASSGIFWTVYLDYRSEGCECSNPGFFTYNEVLAVTTGVATTAAVTTGRQVSSMTSGQTIVTTGQIANIVSSSQKEESSPQNRSSTIIIAVLVSFTILIAGLALFVLLKKVKKTQVVELDSIDSSSNKTLDATSVFAGNAKVVKYRDIAKGELLGKGSFGVVHKGVYKGKVVAMKAILIDGVSDTEMESMRKEALIMSEITPHPNVVNYNHILHNPQLSLVGVTLPPDPIILLTEFCEIGSLHDYAMGTKSLPIPFIQTTLQGICRGIQHLHNHNVIHRDIAMRNILLDHELVPKVSGKFQIDFGLSRIIDDGKTYQNTQMALGPIRWMSPESIMKRQYSRASDVWMLGALVVEMINQNLPWHHLVNHMEVVQVVCYETGIPVLSSFAHPKLVEIVKGCMTREISNRFTLEQVIAILDEGFK